MDSIDIDTLLGDLRRRVATRRANGDYPVGLEEQLEGEFKIIMAAVHRDEVNTSELGRRVKQVESAVAGVRADPGVGSRLPGGSAVHSTTARLVGRHTGVIAESVRALGFDVARALHEVHFLLDQSRSADERQLTEVISSVLDRLAIIDSVAASILLLEQRVAALESLPQTPS